MGERGKGRSQDILKKDCPVIHDGITALGHSTPGCLYYGGGCSGRMGMTI